MKQRNVLLLFGLVFLLTTVAPKLSAQEETSTEFYRVLAGKDHATYEDAVKAVDVLDRGRLVEMPFKKRLERLEKKDIVPDSWSKDPDQRLTRGKLAYMLMKTLNLKGGLITRLFGLNTRYAYKELVFRNIMASGAQSRLVAGEEVISVLRSAAQYRKKHLESAD